VSQFRGGKVGLRESSLCGKVAGASGRGAVINRCSPGSESAGEFDRAHVCCGTPPCKPRRHDLDYDGREGGQAKGGVPINLSTDRDCSAFEVSTQEQHEISSSSKSNV
jgi:hypothetical protein